MRAKRVTIWRLQAAHRPETLADALRALAGVENEVSVVMGYRNPGQPDRATWEIYPVIGRKARKVAESFGFEPSETPTLLVDSQSDAGLPIRLAEALSRAGILTRFLVAQQIGGSLAALVGFESRDDAALAGRIIRSIRD